MRKTTSILTVLALLFAGQLALASDHLVPANTARARVATAASERSAHIQTLERVLASPQAAQATAALGTSTDRVRTALSTLTDSEARDLAQRAQALGVDPAAGHEYVVHDLLGVFLVIAIVLLVLDAASH